MIAPTGDFMTVKRWRRTLVEMTPTGRQIASKTLGPNGAGDLFGLALSPRGQDTYYVSDAGSSPDAN